MRWLCATVFFLASLALIAQDVECDGAFYLVIYNQSDGNSRLFRINQEANEFRFTQINLSEQRRLTSLSYNVNDKRLYALDVDNRAVIQIDAAGIISVVGEPDDLKVDYDFQSGDITADGGSMSLFGYDENFQSDTRFYSVDFSRANLRVGFLGVTGQNSVRMTDLATDPITGITYAYDQLQSQLATVGTGGGVSSINFAKTGEPSIDALFFDQSGILFGYSPSRGLFQFDKGTGEIQFIVKGPEGTSADGCSCPYTFDFTKEIEPKEIIPCEPFKVKYTFINRMGIGQIMTDFRDTFPPGFKILTINNSLIQPLIDITEPNIFKMDRFTYVMRENTIELLVEPPPDFVGEFESHAYHSPLPFAFQDQLFSDDPVTPEEFDPTGARVISENDIDFSESIVFNCEGTEATIYSPVEATTYQWFDGSDADSVIVDQPGNFELIANGTCIQFDGSATLMTFPAEKQADLGEDVLLTLGDSVFLMPILNRGIPDQLQWFQNGVQLNCEDCEGIWVRPLESSIFSVQIVDINGCELTDDVRVEVDVKKNIYVPNAFSPNGDNVNDVLFISSSVAGIVESFRVFDRWGSLIYEAIDYPIMDSSIGWDGTYNGQTVEQTNYVWHATLQFVDGETKSISGQVAVLASDE
jgi:gliding motility-associated-like protein